MEGKGEGEEYIGREGVDKTTKLWGERSWCGLEFKKGRERVHEEGRGTRGSMW